MAQPATDKALSGRAAARARRSLLAAHGNVARPSGWAVSDSAPVSAPLAGRAAARARRAAQATAGKLGADSDMASGGESLTFGGHHQGSGSRQTSGKSSSESIAAPASSEQGWHSQAPRAAQAALSTMSEGRRLALLRRRALASRGKSAVTQRDRTRSAPELQTSVAPQAAPKSCGCGCRRAEANEETPPKQSLFGAARKGERRSAAGARANTRALSLMSEGRQFSLARRRALASRGKTAAYQQDRSRSPAEQARQIKPDLSGRELAREVRAERSRNGGRRRSKSAPCGRVRQRPHAAAQDAPWKVGVSETSHGQSVTGTQVGRSRQVTGDEPSTCRAITGTEYLGADIFRSFCQSEVAPSPRKVSLTSTVRGRPVTGSEVGRSASVTGNEPGTCQRVTGTEYVSAEQASGYCGTPGVAGSRKISQFHTQKGQPVTGTSVGRSSKVTGDEVGASRVLTGTEYVSGGNGVAPPKVGLTSTLGGGGVTGTLVGRSPRVTGDEPGSCRVVTGDEYTSLEQYQAFCPETPQPEPPKVGLSQTFKGQRVTGTQTGRRTAVTGNEPGTCKTITGTPYAGLEQYRQYCDQAAQGTAAARARRLAMTPGAALTGQQPGINGQLTGAERGACEPITGTPYVGFDQYAEICPAEPASPHSSDFPQALEGAPWTSFSVTSPAREAQQMRGRFGITGTVYEQGQITGPFGMGEGKVTGTEQFRFGWGQTGATLPAATVSAPQPEPEAVPRPRITGEGMDRGLRITGDDWERGERITGTEGTSATRRNLTRRGGAMSAMPTMLPYKRNESAAEPAAKITGSSGSTEKGALVTLSGGARG